MLIVKENVQKHLALFVHVKLASLEHIDEKIKNAINVLLS